MRQPDCRSGQMTETAGCRPARAARFRRNGSWSLPEAGRLRTLLPDPASTRPGPRPGPGHPWTAPRCPRLTRTVTGTLTVLRRPSLRREPCRRNPRQTTEMAPPRGCPPRPPPYRSLTRGYPQSSGPDSLESETLLRLIVMTPEQSGSLRHPVKSHLGSLPRASPASLATTDIFELLLGTIHGPSTELPAKIDRKGRPQPALRTASLLCAVVRFRSAGSRGGRFGTASGDLGIFV